MFELQLFDLFRSSRSSLANSLIGGSDRKTSIKNGQQHLMIAEEVGKEERERVLVLVLVYFSLGLSEFYC